MRKLVQQAALIGLPLFFVAQFSLAQAPVDVRSVSSPDYNQRGNTPQESIGELYYQLQLLKQEVMELRGIVEEQTNEVRQLRKENLDRYIELDKRMSSVTAAAAAAPVEPVAEPAKADDKVEVVEAAPEPKAKSKSKPKGITVRRDESSAEAQAYRDAFDMVKARQFDSALYAFENFIEQYPDGDFAPNAYYWTGELYLVVEPMDLGASRTAFNKLLSKYPRHPKVPDAMFKLGKVYFLQDEKGKSKHLMNQVIDRYGRTDSSAPRLATEFLKDNF